MKILFSVFILAVTGCSVVPETFHQIPHKDIDVQTNIVLEDSK